MNQRIIILLLLALLPLRARERPNILWITSEDNAFHWLGCYGNEAVLTPRMDALAAGGIRFTHAYSNAPVCAVARSTILNGVYAPAQGTQHMRSRYTIPARYQPYVSYLRKAGYYCTNHTKTDYNIKGNDLALWDDCSGKAHYKNRPDGKPFFAVFNLTISHESSLFPKTIAKLYRGGVKPRIQPADIKVPPYLPDLPEIRHDLAVYTDTMQKLDGQVGKILDDLDKAGLADDTIVFYYSDHGGILPRGKRYLTDTGTRVPMIIHFPEKWAHLCPFKAGSSPDELVSFVDLAPTLLSLAGIDTPPQMQGRAFLGSHRAEPPADDTVYLFADRFDEILSGMQRGLTDGRWRYIRTFDPHLPAAPRSTYPFQQAGWKAWRKAWQDGKLDDPRFRQLWEAPRAVEQLYDTLSDPWEIHNLADSPEQASRLAAMRAKLKQRMAAIGDTSVIPESMFESLADKQPVADYLAGRKADLPELVELAFISGSGNVSILPALNSKLTSPDPLTRYWAAHGCVVLGQDASPAASGLKGLLADEFAAIRITAALALHRIGQAAAAHEALIAELQKPQSEASMLYALNTLHQTGGFDTIPANMLEQLNGNYPNTYVDRFIQDFRPKP